MSSISDDRGEELLYAGMPISDVFKVSPLCQSIVSLHVCVCMLYLYRRTSVLEVSSVYCGSREGMSAFKK